MKACRCLTMVRVSLGCLIVWTSGCAMTPNPPPQDPFAPVQPQMAPPPMSQYPTTPSTRAYRRPLTGPIWPARPFYYVPPQTGPRPPMQSQPYAPQRMAPRTYGRPLPPSATFPPNREAPPNQTAKPPLPADEPPPKPPVDDGPQLEPPADDPFSTRQTPPDASSDAGVELQIDAPDRRPVGSGAPLQLTIRNRGEQPLRNVSIVCDFDEALKFPGSDRRSVTHKIPRIDPGDVRESLLTLVGETPGLHQCRFSVKIGSQVVLEKNVTVEFVSRQLDWQIDGPEERTVGSRAEFNIPLINVSRGELRDLKVRVDLDAALTVREMTQGGRLGDRSITWEIDRLAANEGLLLQLEVECLELTQQACLQVSVLGGELPEDSKEACLEVTQRTGWLDVRVQDVTDPIAVGDAAEMMITIRNEGVQPVRDVAATCNWPDGFEFLSASIEENGESRPIDADVTDRAASLGDPVTLEPDRAIEYRVKLRAGRSGTQRLTVSVTNGTDDTPVQVVEPIMVHR